jgi:hypothetical protein
MNPSVKSLDHERVKIDDSRLPSPVVSYVTGRVWRLEHAYVYQDGPRRITVPNGFEFDLSSVPRWFWFLIAPFELSLAAPLLHDFLYRYAGSPPEAAVVPPKAYSRLETDQLFRRVMVQEGVPSWRRTLAYWAVRLFGRVAWKTL